MVLKEPARDPILRQMNPQVLNTVFSQKYFHYYLPIYFTYFQNFGIKFYLLSSALPYLLNQFLHDLITRIIF